jgi:hypothetical protein
MEEGALPHSFSYESMGTTWKVTLWDDLTQSQKEKIEHEVVTKTKHFDQTFSRFIPTSLISMLAEKTGVVEVPSDLVAMLRLYRSLYTPSMQKLNPLIGHTISDLGYDKEYSLTPKTQIRPTPQFLETLKIVDARFKLRRARWFYCTKEAADGSRKSLFRTYFCRKFCLDIWGEMRQCDPAIQSRCRHAKHVRYLGKLQP